MTLTLISACEHLAFGEPVILEPAASQPPALARVAHSQALVDGRGDVGVWECTPGQFKRQVRQAEYSYIVSGEGCFTPDGGEPVYFSAGDVLYFTADTLGVWDIRSTVRKTYMILAQ
ncbi:MULTISPECIES: cupin domain-containing protein [Pseudomonadaceae]|jgi:uncharacterized cupin superfamily protein|uniref:cupin domain-containing protein n=1 Tax=Pseudomonadaceae TaxID=135621 RepID=UPI000C99A426|nr:MULTISPECIES: cupin domain-containing protein [Pseudomonadaceae]MCI1037273.1 DUF861 domain-containing protein [Pseudomonas putida]PNG82057.1 hypothetical protein CBL13_05675 [Pseudomonas putida]UBT82255.1 DUF861 domain-containing protein [Pseudomonas amygdali]